MKKGGISPALLLPFCCQYARKLLPIASQTYSKPLHMGDKWVTKLQAEPEKKKTVTREWRVTV